MSSLDSQFMCLGTMFTNDIVVKKFGAGRFTDTQKIWIARGFILGVVALTYGLSLALMNSAHVFDLGVWCFSGFTGLFPLVVAALYWRGATAAGAYACILSTVVTWCFLFFRDLAAGKQAGGASDEVLVFGMMPVAVIVAVSTLSLVVVSLATRKPSDGTIRKFFI
jgi:SSS family solute:Na+ symporter